MGKKLYIGNLSYSITDADLHELFAPHGSVHSAQVINDRTSGISKGFGFVEMSSGEEAVAAIAAINGRQIEGRAIVVNEAKPKAAGGFGGRSNNRR